jgi:hypothetical protein
MKSECRYIITDVASIPVLRIGNKGDAYKQTTKPGWGLLEWYSAINNYSAPVNHDKSDKTQQLVCDEDSSGTLYTNYGREFCIVPFEEVNAKEIPTQAEINTIIMSDSCGFSFWEHEAGNVKIFVTYDENGLIDTYRLDNWNGKPYEDETEISFNDLQSQEDYEAINRANIKGTFEYYKQQEIN